MPIVAGVITTSIDSPLRGESTGHAGLDSPLVRGRILAGSPAESTGNTTPRQEDHLPTANTMLTGVLAEHIRAVNAFDTDAIVATFAEDAFINDVSREIQGLDAIRAFVAKEIVGDNVTMDVTEVIDHYGDTIVRAAYDGDYDKTDLPDPLILTNYFSVRDEKIVSLITIHNKPSEY
jgi:SnoaL-like protein